nr:hypothetical protein GCM10020093_051480 [Planobispora longispora]
MALIAAACVGGPASPPPAHPAAHGPPRRTARTARGPGVRVIPAVRIIRAVRAVRVIPAVRVIRAARGSVPFTATVPGRGVHRHAHPRRVLAGRLPGHRDDQQQDRRPDARLVHPVAPPPGATITQAWKGTHMQSGPIAMIHAPADDPVLAPGATVSEIGFIGAAPTPPSFTEITCG